MQIHRYSVSALVLLLIACPRTTSKDVETGDVADSDTAAADADGDGFAQSEDCNDSDASVHPDARELCDEVDNDCDGLLDDEDPDVFGTDTWYADYDLDGYGGEQLSLEACEQPDGYVDNSRDCNDTDANIHPEAEEACDGLDNDCDGVTDGDEASGAPAWYVDADGDGFGTTDSTLTACDPPAGYSLHDGDCDDTDAAFHPGASEADCTDPADYNCDGSVGFEDADADGFAACEDCNDASFDINDDAQEICDGLDNDCDDEIDSDDGSLDGALIFYGDSDGDGYGGTQYQAEACEAPPGYVSNADDCDDLDGTSHPGASEICDDADNDCDSDIDEGVGSTWYTDADGDGYGNGSVSTTSCDAPSGYVGNALDCDDFTAATSPAAYEICDGADNNCDGTTDEDSAINAATWYQDADGDGYGTSTGVTTACDQPSGYAATDTDCNDADASVSPGATEICDTIDNDCDGNSDGDTAVDATAWYADTDSDGYGSPSSTTSACTAPSGHVSDGTDCDDTNPAVNPLSDEVCDAIDNNCDGTTDEDAASDAQAWYADTDSDGYGDDSSLVTACSQPVGYSSTGGDCNDDLSSGGALVNPGMSETCDGADNNCDGTVDEDTAIDAGTWYADSDSDGYGDDNSSVVACDQPTDHVSTGGDCNDDPSNGGTSASPGATEICDGVDNDCSGTADDGAATGTGPSCPFTGCASVLTADASASSGSYYIDPDGSGSYQAFCDLTGSGGPWTWHTATEAAVYWSFDGSDVSASDVGGFSGTVHGNTSASSTTPATGFGNSLQSDNTDSGYVDLSSSVVLATNWSVAYWGQNDNCSNNQIPILFEDSSWLGDLHYKASFYVSGHGYVFQDSGGCSSYVNTWRHFVHVDDGSQHRVWIDGVEFTSPSSYSYTSSSGLRINRLMNRPNFGTNGLGGYIDDLAVYDSALSEEEVQRIYNQASNGRPLRWQ